MGGIAMSPQNIWTTRWTRLDGQTAMNHQVPVQRHKCLTIFQKLNEQFGDFPPSIREKSI